MLFFNHFETNNLSLDKSSKRFVPNANRANVRGTAAGSQQRRLSIVGQQSHAAAIAAASVATSVAASPVVTAIDTPAPPSPVFAPIQNPLGPPPAPIRPISITPLQRPPRRVSAVSITPITDVTDGIVTKDTVEAVPDSRNETATPTPVSTTITTTSPTVISSSTPSSSTPVRLKGLSSRPSYGGRGYPGFKPPSIKAIERPQTRSRRESSIDPKELPPAKKLRTESPESAIAEPPLSPRSKPAVQTERETRSSRKLRNVPEMSLTTAAPEHSRSRSEMLDDEPVSLRDSLANLSVSKSAQKPFQAFANIRTLASLRTKKNANANKDSLSISARLSDLRGRGGNDNINDNHEHHETGLSEDEVEIQAVNTTRQSRLATRNATKNNNRSNKTNEVRSSVTDTLESYNRVNLNGTKFAPINTPGSEFISSNFNGAAGRGRPSNREPTPPSPPREPSPPKKVERRDSKGRIIVDPEDLPKFGRGHRRVDVENSNEKIINTETFTMKDLCKELPIGRKSSDFDAFEAAKKKRKEARERLRNMQKKDKTGLATAEEREELEKLEEQKRKQLKAQQKKVSEELQDYRSGPSGNMQLMMSNDGEIVVDSQSTVVDRHVNANNDETEREVEDVDKYNNLTNNSSYNVKGRSERWDEDETHHFYQAVSMWGTDFNLISHMFKNRTRGQIKTKFKLEERRNPAKIHLAIMRKLPVDLEDYSEKIRLPLKTVAEIDKELNELRARHEEMVKKEEQERVKAREEDAAKAEQKEREMFGDKIKNDDTEQGEEIVGEVRRVKQE